MSFCPRECLAAILWSRSTRWTVPGIAFLSIILLVFCVCDWVLDVAERHADDQQKKGGPEAVLYTS